jgi:hypothetical protein
VREVSKEIVRLTLLDFYCRRGNDESAGHRQISFETITRVRDELAALAQAAPSGVSDHPAGRHKSEAPKRKRIETLATKLGGLNP